MRALALALLVACGGTAPSPAPPLLADAPQLLLGTSAGWDATSVTLQRYERRGGGWVAVGEPVPAVLGRSGAAWGRGLHGAGAPADRAGPVKREGDGRSPAGAFRILRAFGYDDAAFAVPYQKVDESWRCVDDGASAHYNDVLDADGVTPDWTSAEEMRRPDALYRWVVEIDHNAASGDGAVPGGGSCIFLHVWGGPDDTTAGCTAMAEPDLTALLAWLRPGAVYVLLPEPERAALAAAWGLPGRP